MALKKSKRRKINGQSLLIIGIVLLLFFWLFGTKMIQIAKLQHQKNEIQAQITVENDESDELDKSLAQIGTKEYNEIIARKYLGLYYPDEKIVVSNEGENEDLGE